MYLCMWRYTYAIYVRKQTGSSTYQCMYTYPGTDKERLSVELRDSIKAKSGVLKGSNR